MTGTGTCHIRRFCALKLIYRHQPKTRKDIKPLGLSDSRASLVRALYDINRYLWRKIKILLKKRIYLYFYM